MCKLALSMQFCEVCTLCSAFWCAFKCAKIITLLKFRFICHIESSFIVCKINKSVKELSDCKLLNINNFLEFSRIFAYLSCALCYFVMSLCIVKMGTLHTPMYRLHTHKWIFASYVQIAYFCHRWQVAALICHRWLCFMPTTLADSHHVPSPLWVPATILTQLATMSLHRKAKVSVLHLRFKAILSSRSKAVLTSHRFFQTKISSFPIRWGPFASLTAWSSRLLWIEVIRSTHAGSWMQPASSCSWNVANAGPSS